MREYTDTEVIEFLCKDGIPLDANMLMGDPGEELITLYLPEIGVRHRVIENDELSLACKAFLARRGARRFPGLGELYDAVRTERWPGWEQHAPGLPG